MGDELWRKSATELAGLIARGEASSREVIDAHLARIDDVDGHLNALTRVLGDEARAAADAADRVVAEGGELGPLHGVPVTVKENIDLAGTPTTWGVPAMAEAVATIDAPLVERLRAAGAIPLARTNLPEMALRISTNNPLHGLTRNPWDPEVTAGGSSGGEGAAIASGMSPLGFGNDIGGSLRNPAWCCGISSLKPTQGRVPMASVLPPEDTWLGAQLMATDGPMARRIDDLEIALRIISGQHVRDPRSVTVAFEGPDVQRRAALVTEVPGGSLIGAAADAVRAAGDVLAAAGWDVTEALPPEIEQVNLVWGHVLTRGVRGLAPLLAEVMSEGAMSVLHDLDTRFPETDMPGDTPYMERGRLGRAWAGFFVRYPVVVGPVWTDWPFPHDADLADDGAAMTLDRLRFITPGNLLGIPGAVVPTGVVDGRPLSVQVYADRFRDDLALQAARDIEAATGIITPIDPSL